jgi:hypothetical protein
MKGALSQHAEHTYDALPTEEHRRLTRVLFVRLIDPGATEQDTTRRRATLSEFTLVDAAQTRLLRETIDAFIAARLLTTNEIAGTTTIEVSHEALIREWPRLAVWLREAREDILLQKTISKDAAEWEQRNKPGDRLYRGTQLKEAQAWARRNTPSSNELAFLHAGVARRVRFFASVSVIVLLLLSTTGVAGWFITRPDPTHVTTLNDNGPGSLRQAIDVVGPGGTITFDNSLHGTILLSSGDLNIAKDLIIRGPDAAKLSISSGNSGYDVHVLKGLFSVTISGLTFKDSNTNTSSGNSFIYNEGTLKLNNSTISGNTATDGGGIHNSNMGTLILTNSTVSGNTADPGIGNDNSSSNGGGIENVGTLTVNNSTISSNTATFGGGIASVHGTANIRGSIVAKNTGGNCDITLSDQGYNLESSTDCGFKGTGSLQNTDPKLDPKGLHNNGGPTQTIALQRNSLAIDQIPLATCSINGITTDQRGDPRPDGSKNDSRPDENGDKCDIGAYESLY